MFSKFFILIVIFCTLSLYADQNVKIAILAFKSKADTKQEWNYTENYLNQNIKEFHFMIIPMNYPELEKAVQDSSVDFVITNSGQYVYFETKNHISRIATMTKYKRARWLDSFGGVIFTRSNRNDINNISDLNGKKIAVVDEASLGGYSAQMYELQKVGIDKENVKLDFTGMPHSTAVNKVLSGKDDVGFVRTEVLESMLAQGELDSRSIKIINLQTKAKFPFYLSTDLYPEWPIARMPKTSFELANKVVIALLSMKNTTPLKNGDLRWTAPLEYRNIHNIFKSLHLPPYDQPESFTLTDIYNKYKVFVIALAILLFFTIIGVGREFYLRRKVEKILKDLAKSNENIKYQSLKNEMLLRLSGDGIHILDMHGNIVQVSDRFCEMLGYKHDEMIGMNVLAWEDGLTQEDVIENMQKLSIKSIIIQTQHRKKDGTSYDAEVTVTKIKILQEEFIYCSARDITEHLISQAQLKLSALVYENSSDAISITDSNTTVVTVNAAFEKLTGYKANEIIGKNTTILQSGIYTKEFYKEMWNSIDSTGAWAGKITDRKKDGALFTKWLEIMTVFDEHKKPYRRIAKFSEITDEKETQQQIWYQANFDTLTDLPNRSMFMFRLEKRLHDIDLSDIKVALMYLDLDNFKEINDSMGHDRGDILLQESAKRIKQCVRNEDIVSRIGGDEFTIIFPRLDTIEAIEEIAHAILKELSQPFIIDEKNIYISVSIGITIAPEDGMKADTLLKNAEQAMYAAKHAGRNRYSYFTASMQDKIVQKMKIIEDMRNAIDLKEFVLYYQPIMELSSGEVHKAEALIRWKKGSGEMMNPADFIPLSEETGLIVDIGEWVLREACSRAKIWRDMYDDKFQISINKSPVQFKSTKYTSSLVVDVLHELDLASDAIVIEITEGLLMETTVLVKDKLLLFEQQGIALSMDDFGTGYSSLSYLKKFHIDFLKIDQSFVRNLVIDENDRILCEAMVAMAHKLGIQVIAEGVETMDQRDFLSSISCDYIQGYLISRPIEASEFEKKFLL